MGGVSQGGLTVLYIYRSLSLILHLQCEDETGDPGLMFVLSPDDTHAALALRGAPVPQGRGSCI